jgi:hypothetical protein
MVRISEVFAAPIYVKTNQDFANALVLRDIFLLRNNADVREQVNQDTITLAVRTSHPFGCCIPVDSTIKTIGSNCGYVRAVDVT